MIKNQQILFAWHTILVLFHYLLSFSLSCYIALKSSLRCETSLVGTQGSPFLGIFCSLAFLSLFFFIPSSLWTAPDETPVQHCIEGRNASCYYSSYGTDTPHSVTVRSPFPIHSTESNERECSVVACSTQLLDFVAESSLALASR